MTASRFIACGLFLLACSGCKLASEGTGGSLVPMDREAPEISGPDIDGKDFKLSDYRGKVVMLDFWGNW